MKTIGLIGGLSWQSSIDYYRLINQNVQRRLGGHGNARSVMVSADFAEADAVEAGRLRPAPVRHHRDPRKSGGGPGVGVKWPGLDVHFPRSSIARDEPPKEEHWQQ